MRTFVVLLVMMLTLSVGAVFGGQAGLERELREQFVQSRALVATMLADETVDDARREQLSVLADEIRAAHLLLSDRFSRRDERLAQLGNAAQERHTVMRTRYREQLDTLLQRFDACLAPSATLTDLNDLHRLLSELLPEKKYPVLGSLPYTHLSTPGREPLTDPIIKPAYRGGDRTVNPEDTVATLLTPRSAEIVALAESLDWNPAQIYQWSLNNLKSEWYWGAMKGAEETLRQGSGNAVDQAALLVALLRASDFPARFVRGVIELPGGVERWQNLTGVDSANGVGTFLQRAGIPYQPVIEAGRIANYRIEHIWVETEVPYANYRGAVIDGHGKQWIALDTFVKPQGNIWSGTADLPDSFDWDGLRDAWLNTPHQETPVEFVRDQITAAGATYNSLLRTAEHKQLNLQILPASLQFHDIAITGELLELPDELIYTATISTTTVDGKPLFSITRPVAELSNRNLSLFFEPETIEDLETINAWGGLDNTPAYLVRLRPTLRLDGERIAVATDGLPSGADYRLNVELNGPAGVHKTGSTQLVGNLIVVALTAQQAVMLAEIDESEKNAPRLLQERALDYIDRWNKAEDELASLLRLNVVRPLPTVVTLGNVLDVSTLLGSPHDIEWRGVFIDAGLRRVETVAPFGAEERERQFMKLAALQGSVLENRIFEDAFGVESVSAAKLLSINPSVVVEQSNLNAFFADSVLPDYIQEEVRNAVNRGMMVRIPDQQLNYLAWSGFAWSEEQSETGAAGYMLSGMIGGGMTAWSVDLWSSDPTAQVAAENLAIPYGTKVNKNPADAFYILRVPATDLQVAKVGDQLKLPLQVKVLDQTYRPVQGAVVRFTSEMGGGTFVYGTGDKKMRDWPTDSKGISEVSVTLGERTGDNPTHRGSTPHVTQLGANIFNASLLNEPKTAIDKPFTAFGEPHAADHLEVVHGSGGFSPILSLSGTLAVRVVDKFGNPVPNKSVKFTAVSPPDYREAELFANDVECSSDVPVVDECGFGGQNTLNVLSKTDGSASVRMMLGGMPEATYQVVATLGERPPVTMSVTTHSIGNPDDKPDVQMYLSKIVSGNIGAPGQTLSLQARLYAVAEEETTKSVQGLQCGEGIAITCEKITGTGTYDLSLPDDFDSRFVTDSYNVVFNDVVAEHSGEGVFAADYTLPGVPGIYNVVIKAEADMTQRYTDFCDGCTTKERTINNQWRNSLLQVFSVAVQFNSVEPISINSLGETTANVEMPYTIQPAEYKAQNAYLLLYKGDNDGAYSGFPVDLQGRNLAVLTKGFRFEPGQDYEVQIVLNYGTDYEIKSERRKLVIAGLVIKDGDNPLNPLYPFVFISSEPKMPQLSAQLFSNGSAPLVGNVEWRLMVEFDRTGRTRKREDKTTYTPEPFVDCYPSSTDCTNDPVYQSVPVNEAWNIFEEFRSVVDGKANTHFRGGKATLIWRHKEIKTPDTSEFYIRGKNPTRDELKKYVENLFSGNEKPIKSNGVPWFLYKIALHESGSNKQNVAKGIVQQFNEKSTLTLGPFPDTSKNYTPNWGLPDGWGIWQLDPPLSAQTLWNWQENTLEGLGVVENKRVYAASKWGKIIKIVTDWNLKHPDSQINNSIAYTNISNDEVCRFSFQGNGSNGEYSFFDADWIKRYNGGKFITVVSKGKLNKDGRVVEKPRFKYNEFAYSCLERSGKKCTKWLMDSATGKKKKIWYVKEICSEQI